MKERTMSVFRKSSFLIVATAAAGALSFARPLWGQKSEPPADNTITFDDAITMALKQNVGVRQAQNAADLSDADVKAQKMQLLPDLKLSVSGADNVGRSLSGTDGSLVNTQTQSLSSG